MNNVLKKILPHLHFIMIVVFVTLLIVDICNPYMDFINNNITMGFLWFYGALYVITGVVIFSGSCRTLFSTASIVVGVALIVILIADICATNGDYINNNITKGFLWFCCILSAITGGVMLADDRNNGEENRLYYINAVRGENRGS